MAFSEGLSDTGEFTGRGNPLVRGGITGRRDVRRRHPALAAVPDPELPRRAVTASIVVAFELVALAALRARFFSTRFTTSLGAVSLAGAVIVAVSVALGAAA